MAFLNELSQEARMKKLRAGVRLNSRVSVMVEWVEAGKVLRVEGYTIDISTSGCLVVAPQGFAVGQKLRLVNLVNANVCDAALIWRGHEGREGWELGLELGLELVEPSLEFWGVDF